MRMGKVVSIAIAVGLQLGLVLACHIYFTSNPKEVAIVVESSYGLTAHRNDIVKAIDLLEKGRYSNFHYGTDKTYLGEDAYIDSLFRVSFGKIDTSKLEMLYPRKNYNKRYLLSFTNVNNLKNWNIINVGK